RLTTVLRGSVARVTTTAPRPITSARSARAAPSTMPSCVIRTGSSGQGSYPGRLSTFTEKPPTAKARNGSWARSIRTGPSRHPSIAPRGQQHVQDRQRSRVGQGDAGDAERGQQSQQDGGVA